MSYFFLTPTLKSRPEVGVIAGDTAQNRTLILYGVGKVKPLKGASPVSLFQGPVS
jgi:hypothetical protein